MHFKPKVTMKMKLKLRPRAKAKAKAKPLAHSTERALRKRDVFCKILQLFRKFKRSTGEGHFVPEFVSAQHSSLVEELVEVDLPFTTLDDDAYLEYINELLVRRSPESLGAHDSIEVLHSSGLFVNATPETSVATSENPLIVEVAKKAVPEEDVRLLEVSSSQVPEGSAETKDFIEQSAAKVEELGNAKPASDQTPMAHEETIQSFEDSLEASEFIPDETIEQLEVLSLKDDPKEVPNEIVEQLEISLVQTPIESEEALESSEVSPLEESPEKVRVEMTEQLKVSPLDEESEKVPAEIIEQFEASHLNEELEKVAVFEVALVQTPMESEEALESSKVSPLEEEPEVPVETLEQLELSLLQTPMEPEEALESPEVSPSAEQESEIVLIEAFEPVEIPLECEHEIILLAPVETFEGLTEALKEEPRLCLLAPIEVIERSAVSSGLDRIDSLESPEVAKVVESSTDIIVQKWLSCVKEVKEEYAESANEAIEESFDPTILDSHIVSSTTIESTNGTMEDGKSSQQSLEQSTDVDGLIEVVLAGEATTESGNARAGSADDELILLASEIMEPKEDETKSKESKKKNRKRKGKGRRGKKKSKKGGNGNGDSSEAHVSLGAQVDKPDVATTLEKPNKVEVETIVPEVEAEVSVVEVEVPEVVSEAVPEAVPEIEVTVPEVEVVPKVHTVPEAEVKIAQVKVPEVRVEVIPGVVINVAPEVPEVPEVALEFHTIPEVPEVEVEVKNQKALEAKATKALTPQPDTIKAPAWSLPIQSKKMFDVQAVEKASKEANELVSSRRRKRNNASPVRASNNFSSLGTSNSRAHRPVQENRKFMKQPQLKESQAAIDHKKQAVLLPEFTPFEHPEDKDFFDFSTLLTEKEFLAKTNFNWADDPTIDDLI